mmetsp:Transcript_63916/g.128475  ORF Transcript_63916/g.128475 Transcript_63916/m.128475 type:complete len:202 (+) Transcript_63916:168-773(+)
MTQSLPRSLLFLLAAVIPLSSPFSLSASPSIIDWRIHQSGDIVHTRLRIIVAIGASDDEMSPVDDLEKLRVQSSKRGGYRDGRDQLPYYIDVVSPPPRRLGIFALDKNTRTGDLVEHMEKNYEVQRVKNKYRYRAGKGFCLFKKEAEVVEANRLLEEKWLTRVFSMEEPPPQLVSLLGSEEASSEDPTTTTTSSSSRPEDL